MRYGFRGVDWGGGDAQDMRLILAMAFGGVLAGLFACVAAASAGSRGV